MRCQSERKWVKAFKKAKDLDPSLGEQDGKR
jgi:hypothetical protein